MEGKKEYNSFVIKVITDTFFVLLAWFTAYFLRFYIIPGGVGEPFELFAKLSLIALITMIYFLNRNKLYDSSNHTTWLEEIQLVFYSSLQSFLALTVILYFFFDVKVSRVSIALYFVLATIFLILGRILVKNILSSVRMNHRIEKTVLLVGHAEALKQYVDTVEQTPNCGLKILGQADGKHNALAGYPQFEGELMEVIHEMNPDTVVIGYPPDSHQKEQEVVAKCYDLLQTVFVIPNLPFSYIGSKIIEYQEVPIVYLNHSNISYFQKLGKRIFDFFVSLISISVISPLLLLLAFLVKITSPGPVFYKQRRVTEHGKEFTMLKFRSMACSSQQDESEPSWTVPNDFRVTKLGKYMRKTSLDELPQLFNVLAGDMSLIGPRPERPELVGKFIDEIPGYQLRHKVKAGLSGWAQVNGWRGNTSLLRRIEFDLYYIKNWSFMLDIKIIILTFIKGFVNKNAY